MEEILIEKVRTYEVLYNIRFPNYRDQIVRQRAWDEISKELNSNPETIKNTWDKLRRCYINAINRRLNKRDDQKKYSLWKYEEQMSFLLPFINIRKIPENFKDDSLIENQSYYEEFDLSKDQEEDTSDKISADRLGQSNEEFKNQYKQEFSKRKQQQDLYEDSDSEKESELQHNRNFKKYKYKKNEEMDETDMFYLSMARMSKSLPLLEQAKIKLQISNAVLQAQINLNKDK